MIKRFLERTKLTQIRKDQLFVSHIFQIILNTALILLAIVLCVMLGKELFYFVQHAFLDAGVESQYLYFERILIFFLYFEFVAMIIIYFQENYHFPIRYFLYIGITAMVRLVIVDHDNPVNTFLHTCAILILIIGYYIINRATAQKSSEVGQSETN